MAEFVNNQDADEKAHDESGPTLFFLNSDNVYFVVCFISIFGVKT